MHTFQQVLQANPQFSADFSCARPCIFENESGDFTYSASGTLFVVRGRSRYYGITAKHVVGNSAERLRILKDDSALGFVPLTQVARVSDRSGWDSDWTDFEVFTIHYDASPTGAIRVNNLTALTLCRNETLVIVGYPSPNLDVDYYLRRIMANRLVHVGRYLKPSTLDLLCTAQFQSAPDVSTFDGFSGSPLWVCRENPDRLQFAGMALRGSASSGIIHFVAGSVLAAAVLALDDGA